MSTLNTQLLTLLDPEEKHGYYDLKISNRIFIRFMCMEQSYQHVGDRAANSRWNNHFFLPHVNSELTRRVLSCSSVTYFYLYCNDQTSVNQQRSEFLGQASHKIFTANQLPFHLYSAGIEICWQLLTNPPEELNDSERDEMVATAKQHLQELQKLFDQFMTAKLSAEAVDLR